MPFLPPRRESLTETRHSNILRSIFVARTPPVEARSPDCRSNVENAPRHSPVTGQRRAQTPPDGRSHYVVISRDGRKIVTRVHVMLLWQRNPCPDCKSTTYCTTRGQPLPHPQVTSGSVTSVGVRPQTDTQTRVTTIHFASSTTHAECNNGPKTAQ